MQMDVECAGTCQRELNGQDHAQNCGPVSDLLRKSSFGDILELYCKGTPQSGLLLSWSLVYLSALSSLMGHLSNKEPQVAEAVQARRNLEISAGGTIPNCGLRHLSSRPHQCPSRLCLLPSAVSAAPKKAASVPSRPEVESSKSAAFSSGPTEADRGFLSYQWWKESPKQASSISLEAVSREARSTAFDCGSLVPQKQSRQHPRINWPPVLQLQDAAVAPPLVMGFSQVASPVARSRSQTALWIPSPASSKEVDSSRQVPRLPECSKEVDSPRRSPEKY
uniref:Uncharacterized protein n=1 Tax=Ditylenchus dipsaci TaxID=166011 RepID=A0A915ELW1_9BILA